MLAQQLLHFFVFEHPQTHLEEAGFLREEPFAELLVPAVSESADEVRYVVVFAVGIVHAHIDRHQRLSRLTRLQLQSAFKGELPLARILVDLGGEVAFALVGVVPKGYFGGIT